LISSVVADPAEAGRLERHLRALAGVEAESALEVAERGEAFSAWRRFLEALAEQRPFVVVFEDLHWADDAMLDFVDYVADWAGHVPLLIICTARPELLTRRADWGGGKVNSSTTLLSPLDDEETATLVHALLGRSVLDAELQSRLLEHAGGNPLYAEEFTRMLSERPGSSLVPETVQGLIAARLANHMERVLREMGEAFNYLAGRLEGLLAEERESVADLSHRLRTPLTSLRLEAESLDDPDEKEAMIAQVDRLERAMDQVIELARSAGATEPSESDLDEVVNRRAEFWALLAEEQGRALAVGTGANGAKVAVPDDELAVVVDTLIDNVFSHTAQGVGFSIVTGRSDSGSWLEVADEGPGFGELIPGRGVSGRGSTGLGLDIVRKTAVAAGGSLEIDDRPGGGAVVTVRFG